MTREGFREPRERRTRRAASTGTAIGTPACTAIGTSSGRATGTAAGTAIDTAIDTAPAPSTLAAEEAESIADLCPKLEAGLHGSGWALDVLEPVAAFVGAETASLRSIAARSDTMPRPLASLGIPGAVDDAYRDRFHALDPARRLPLLGADGPVIADPERPGQWLNTHLSPAAVRRLRAEFVEYRREFLEPNDFVQHVGFCFQDRAGRTLLFDFHRGRRSRAFGRLEIARARVVARYLYAHAATPASAPPRPAPAANALSAREREVAAAVASGLSNKETAAVLSISVRTVENHLRAIFAKLGVGSRTRLAALLRDAD